jgi:hypothetical protein
MSLLHERPAYAAAFFFGRYGDRANLGQVPAVQMESAAADDAVAVLDYDKIANVF